MGILFLSCSAFSVASGVKQGAVYARRYQNPRVGICSREVIYTLTVALPRELLGSNLLVAELWSLFVMMMVLM